SIEGAMVFPGTAGNARLLRSMARRRCVSRPDHCGTDGHSIPRYKSERKRLLHNQRASMGDHDIPVRVLDPLDPSRDSRYVLAGPKLEFLRSLGVMGHPKTRSSGERDSRGVHLGERSGNGFAEESINPRDVWFPGSFWVFPFATATLRQEVVQRLL